MSWLNACVVVTAAHNACPGELVSVHVLPLTVKEKAAFNYDTVT